MQEQHLANLDEGDDGTIQDLDESISDDTRNMGFVPGARIKVLMSRGGAVKVAVDGKVQSLSAEEASKIYLT